MPRHGAHEATDTRGGESADPAAGVGHMSEPPPRVVDLGEDNEGGEAARSPTLELLPPSPPRSVVGSDDDEEGGTTSTNSRGVGEGEGGGGGGGVGGAGAALLAPVRGLKAIARLCAGGGAVAYAAARRRRRLDGDPDVDGALGGTYARDSPGWRGASFDSARSTSTDGAGGGGGGGGGGGHKVQILLAGRETPDALVTSLSRGSDDYGGAAAGRRRSAPLSRSPSSAVDGFLSAPPTSRGFTVPSAPSGTAASSPTSPALSPRASLDVPDTILSDDASDASPCLSPGPRTTGDTSPCLSALDAADVLDASSPLAGATDPSRTPFAAEVIVRGWQVVGGTSFDSFARVGAYVVYDIEIALRGGARVSILRRYTEFVRLRNDLRRSFPHLRKTIPALPGKNHMHKFSPEFLADRRPRLQRFLRTVMLHPEMGRGGDDSVLGRWVLGQVAGPAQPSNGPRLGAAGAAPQAQQAQAS